MARRTELSWNCEEEEEEYICPNLDECEGEDEGGGGRGVGTFVATSVVRIWNT